MRENPIRRAIEFPISMDVALLLRIKSAHAHWMWHNVGLARWVGKDVSGAADAWRLTVEREYVTGDVIPASPRCNSRGICCSDLPELCLSVWTRWCNGGHSDGADHPPFVPP